MPFGGYLNWDDCVKSQRKKGNTLEQSRRICGEIKKRAEGESLHKWCCRVLGIESFQKDDDA